MLDMDFDYSLIEFEEKKSEPTKSECPKCGKKLGKGGHFHVKACDGNPSKAH